MKKEVNQEKTKQEIAEEAVKEYLKNHLHNPDSYKPIRFDSLKNSNIAKFPFFVKHKYRANNIFGNPVVEEKKFFFSDSLVLLE